MLCIYILQWWLCWISTVYAATLGFDCSNTCITGTVTNELLNLKSLRNEPKADRPIKWLTLRAVFHTKKSSCLSSLCHWINRTSPNHMFVWQPNDSVCHPKWMSPRWSACMHVCVYVLRAKLTKYNHVIVTSSPLNGIQKSILLVPSLNQVHIITHSRPQLAAAWAEFFSSAQVVSRHQRK